jgi:hypothetical protein
MFEQLEAVAERIEDVEPVESDERLVRDGRKACGFASRRQVIKAAHEDRWMRFAGRAKVCVNAEVQLQRSTSEPHPATSGQIRRLLLLDQPKHAGIERSRSGLLSCRHRELHVIETKNLGHATFSVHSRLTTLTSVLALTTKTIISSHACVVRP